MKFRHLLTVVCLAFLATQTAYAEGNDLKEGWYELRLNKEGFEGSDGVKYKADEGSDFHIVDDKAGKIELYFTDVEGKGSTYVKEKELYKIDASELSAKYWKRLRIAHGLLIVPFKLRNEDKTLTGESSLGYYIGLENQWLQAKFSYVLAAGLTLIPIADATGKVDEKTGVTAAAGWIFTTMDNFQIGAFIGIDHLGGDNGKNWKYEDDPWISISIGYNFAR